MVIRIVHRLLLLVCHLVVIGVLIEAFLLLVVRRVHLLSSHLRLLLVGELLWVRMPFLGGLPLRLVRLPFVARLVLDRRARVEVRLPLRRISPHEAILRRELGPVLHRVLPGHSRLLHHLCSLLVLPQLAESLILVILHLIFAIIMFVSHIILLRLLVWLLVLVLAPVIDVVVVVSLLLLLHSHVLVLLPIAFLLPVVVLLLGLSLFFHLPLLLLLMMNLPALVSPFFRLFSILGDSLNQGCDSRGRRVVDSLSFLGRHFTLFALFRVPLEFGGQTETLENNLLVLARLCRVGLLVLHESVGKIEFKHFCLSPDLLPERNHRLIGRISSLQKLLILWQVCQSLDRCVELLFGFSGRLFLNLDLLVPHFPAIVLVWCLDHIQGE